MAHLFNPHYQAVDATGPLSGALLYFYTTGTETEITIYTDAAAATPHTNPVVADASGRFAPIYVPYFGFKTVLKTSGGTTIQTIDPVNPLFGRGAPVIKTANFTVGVTEHWLINNKSGSSCTVTLPTASSFPSREIMIQNYQAQTVVSASSNVVPLGGGSAGTAILSGAAGKWAVLVSDATNWVIQQGVI